MTVQQGPQSSNSMMLVVLFLYLVIEYFRPQYWFPSLAVFRPAMILTIILAIFSFANIKDAVYRDSSIRAAIGFVVLCAMSVSYAVNTFWAFNITLNMVAHLFAFVVPLGILISGRSELRKFVLFWVAIHAYLAVFGLTHNGRGPGSFLSDENDLALALNVAIPYAYFLRVAADLSPKIRMLLTATTILLIVGVIMTFSRGGFVGLAVTAMALIFFSKRKMRNCLIMSIVVIAFYVGAPNEYVAEMQTISDTREKTAAGRLYQWTRGWEMYIDNPVLGVGASNYPWRVVEYELKSGELAPNRRLHGGRAAHSLYFTLLPELGTVGALLFVLVLVGAIRNLRETIRRESSVTSGSEISFIDATARATLVGLVAFLATGIFISVLYYPPFWYLVGFAYVLSRVSSAEHTRAPVS